MSRRHARTDTERPRNVRGRAAAGRGLRGRPSGRPSGRRARSERSPPRASIFYRSARGPGKRAGPQTCVPGRSPSSGIALRSAHLLCARRGAWSVVRVRSMDGAWSGSGRPSRVRFPSPARLPCHARLTPTCSLDTRHGAEMGPQSARLQRPRPVCPPKLSPTYTPATRPAAPPPRETARLLLTRGLAPAYP